MKNNLLLLLCLFFCFQCFSQSDVPAARWMNQPVTVDGINNEWGELNFYDDETQLNFAIANDSNNIYLCFEPAGQMDEMKILRAGMKVTLSTKGKSKHEASILFPLPQLKQQMQVHSSDENNADSSVNNFHKAYDKESFRQNFTASHSTMEVSGFSTLNGQVPVKNPGVQVAVNWDSSSNLIYEIAISKKEFFGADYSSKETSNDITLSVEVNALPRSAATMQGKSNYQGGGMHGGMHGGGMHQGGGYNGGGYHHQNGEENSNINTNSFSSLSQKTSFKQKFVLNNNSGS